MWPNQQLALSLLSLSYVSHTELGNNTQLLYLVCVEVPVLYFSDFFISLPNIIKLYFFTFYILITGLLL